MDAKQAGWELFGRAEWGPARAAFAAALEEEPGDPEALDGLGQALWWLGERDAAIDRRREAYVAYKRRGDRRRAGGLATYLAGEHRIDGRHAEAAGWLSRAGRLLAGERAIPELDGCGSSARSERRRRRSPSAVPAPRSSSPTSWPTPTSSAWPWRSSAVPQCGRAAPRMGSRSSTRR
jgi:tetratricopeptide (TPR) repeat protein